MVNGLWRAPRNRCSVRNRPRHFGYKGAESWSVAAGWLQPQFAVSEAAVLCVVAAEVVRTTTDAFVTAKLISWAQPRAVGRPKMKLTSDRWAWLSRALDRWLGNIRPLRNVLGLGQRHDVVPEEMMFRQAQGLDAAEFVQQCRAEVAARFLKGRGLEVGAGTRPVPLPAGAQCYYGDVRDAVALSSYFGQGTTSSFDGHLDAQTFKGVPSKSQDFVISAHVIEHLHDPIGAIRESLRILKAAGILFLVVPDRRHTFDRDRPPTALAHLLQDEIDGGASTQLQAYEDHARYVHTTLTGEVLSEDRIKRDVIGIMKAGMDVHFHCWSTSEFREVIDYCCQKFGARLVALAGEVVNENIFVVQRN